MASRFQIGSIRLVEAHFSLNRQFKWESGKPVEIPQNVEIKYQQIKEKSIRVLVSVSSVSDQQPFRFSVAWEGSFVFEEKPRKEELERIAHIHCASIMFAYIRESVADLTRRASLPALNLPPYNFAALYEENKKSAPSATPRKIRKKPEALQKPSAPKQPKDAKIQES